ncbi:hypothetical protein Patl1_27703 [Pistacia atlantica]|uniref:Uncharacterized protein n=1 Tax=Pistacia atlantica TaxID=434234 RepID=A0ACC1BH16_9ROSI|nr:hypothetical protein Patl1_27703 [Pistacia atlantica]
MEDPFYGIKDTTTKAEGGDNNDGVAPVMAKVPVGCLPSFLFEGELAQICKDYGWLPTELQLAANSLRFFKVLWSGFNGFLRFIGGVFGLSSPSLTRLDAFSDSGSISYSRKDELRLCRVQWAEEEKCLLSRGGGEHAARELVPTSASRKMTKVDAAENPSSLVGERGEPIALTIPEHVSLGVAMLKELVTSEMFEEDGRMSFLAMMLALS